jgi:hypothetical protein
MKLLTVLDAAKELQVSPDMIRKAIRAGRLRAENLSPPDQRPYYVITPQDLAAYRRLPREKPGPKPNPKN